MNSMRRCVSAAVVAAVVAAGSTALVARPAGAVTNAPPTTQPAWAVQLVIRKISNGKTTSCSGSVITQHWVLTAAHWLGPSVGAHRRGHGAARYEPQHGLPQSPGQLLEPSRLRRR